MSDYSKLKELAEALESATSQYLDDETNNELGDEWSIANDRYVDASSPEVVLGLIRDAEQSEQDYKDVVGTIELRDFEIARLKAELKKTDADRKACWAEFKVQGCHLDQVKAECEGLRLDAERYRWLRGRDLEAIHEGGVFAGQTPRNVVLNGEDLDAAIDAAIQAIEGAEVATVEGGVQAT